MSESKKKNDAESTLVTKAKPVNDSVIYLGKTINDAANGFLLKSGTIYNNGIPEHVSERAKIDAEIIKNIVPVNEAGRILRYRRS